MSEIQAAKRPTGTAWIIGGAIGLVIAVLYLLRMPIAADDGMAGIVGGLVGMAIFATAGGLFLARGIKTRKRYNAR